MLHGSRNEALVMSGSGTAARTSQGVYGVSFLKGVWGWPAGWPRPVPLLLHAGMHCRALYACCCGALSATRHPPMLLADGAAPNGTSH